MAGKLIVIYGPALAGKTTLAWPLARSLGAKSAVVSTDHLTTGTFAVPDADALAELDMVHVQLRLLVANYLKNGYNAVVEGPFCFERDGVIHGFEAEIDQLVALMRHLTSTALIVGLTADEETLERRARQLSREDELPAALRVRSALKPRYGERFHQFDTGKETLEAMLAALGRELS